MIFCSTDRDREKDGDRERERDRHRETDTETETEGQKGRGGRGEKGREKKGGMKWGSKNTSDQGENRLDVGYGVRSRDLCPSVLRWPSPQPTRPIECGRPIKLLNNNYLII